MQHFLKNDATAASYDRKVRESLSRYFDAMQDKKPCNFRVAKKLSAPFENDDSLQKLWSIHEQLTTAFKSFREEIDSGKRNFNDLEDVSASFLDLKIAIAQRMLGSCHFCERRCGANRFEGQVGYCRCGSKISVSSIFEHLGEEPELVPSGTIFTLGCTIRCLHCQNWTISQWLEDGTTYEPRQLALAVEQLRKNGCRNANLVGGEPTPWLCQWLETFRHVNVNIPVVWNSNSYYGEETAKLLAGFVDVYLLDFKYGSNECSQRISDAAKYWETCTRNHLYAKEHGELLIRVLVLPEHLECCTKPTLEWIAQNIGKNTRTNIMFQYRPEWNAHQIPELQRRLTTNEIQKAMAIAKKAGLTNFLT